MGGAGGFGSGGLAEGAEMKGDLAAQFAEAPDLELTGGSGEDARDLVESGLEQGGDMLGGFGLKRGRDAPPGLHFAREGGEALLERHGRRASGSS